MVPFEQRAIAQSPARRDTYRSRYREGSRLHREDASTCSLLLKVNFDGHKFDLVLSNVIDISEWTSEASLSCSRIPSVIDENLCTQSILAWGENIASYVKALKPPRKDTYPEFVPATTAAAWYGIERDKGVVYIEPYDLLTSMMAKVSGTMAFEGNIPWPHLVVDNLVNPNSALNRSSHTLGSWRAQNDNFQVFV